MLFSRRRIFYRLPYLSGVNAAGHGPVHVPEGALLAVEDLPLESIPLLVHPATSGIRIVQINGVAISTSNLVIMHCKSILELTPFTTNLYTFTPEFTLCEVDAKRRNGINRTCTALRPA